MRGTVLAALALAAIPAALPAQKLFSGDSVLALTLEADLKTLRKMRDTTRITPLPATLTFPDEKGPRTLPLLVSTRGHFRLRADVCDFPPLRLQVEKDSVKGTLLRGIRRLKLVTHCRTGNRESAQITVSEWLAYRTLNLLTPYSYRARLVRMTYRQTGKPEAIEDFGLLLEPDGMLAERVKLREANAERFAQHLTDRAQMRLVTVFEYMLGNLDWSVPVSHNMTVLLRDSLPPIAVPYDWDHSGIVEASYAKPPAAFRLGSVRERVYRGYCEPADSMEATFARFREQKDAMLALWRDEPRLDAKRRARAVQYLEEFFRAIGDPKAVRKEFLESCRKLGEGWGS